ncbi:MAG: hypothetical protein ACRCX2_10305 [Paraclostridium sp.]
MHELDNPVRKLGIVVNETISQLDIDLETDKLVTNFMNMALIDLAYLLSAKEDEFPLEYLEKKEIDYVYLFCKERNRFWKGTHGYTDSIRQAQLFPIEVAKYKVDEPCSNNKIVFFEGANW